ncbi:MAG: TonB family protein [Zetaproteobacteria bacterium]|nr:TonB family protein [Zetaproteobacteria bacterium]
MTATASRHISSRWIAAILLSLIVHIALMLFTNAHMKPAEKKVMPVMDIVMINPNEVAEKLDKKSVLGHQPPPMVKEPVKEPQKQPTKESKKSPQPKPVPKPEKKTAPDTVAQIKPPTKTASSIPAPPAEKEKKEPQQIAEHNRLPSLQDLMLSPSALQALTQQQTTPNSSTEWSNDREAEIPINTRNAKYSPYAHDLIRALEEQWRPQPDNYQQMTESSKQVLLRLTIEHDGSIGNIEILRPSPVEHLNISSIDAIQRAAPFKPLPSAWGLDRAKFLLTFEVVDNRFVFR